MSPIGVLGLALCLLPALSSGDMCTNPKGAAGDVLREGCIKTTCKRGIWRSSMDQSVCCYNGEAYELGSTISTISSPDSCITTALECAQAGLKTVISQVTGNKGCQQPAQKSQVRQIIDLLEKQVSESESSGCSDPTSNTKTLTGAVSGPEIVENPPDIVVLLNEPVTLNCKVNGDPEPTVEWYKDGELVTTAREDPRSHKILLPNNGLFFLRAKANDSGQYWCKASNIGGTVTSRKANLQLEYSEILLIGPAYPGNLQTEVYHLPSFKKANCTPPLFPFSDYHAYVGKLTGHGPLLCAGTHHSGALQGLKWNEARQSSCYLLNKESGIWETHPTWPLSMTKGLREARFGAASVEMHDGSWWVAGGHTGSKRLSSSELLDPTAETWRDYVSLPAPLHGHCMVSINYTHVFLAGGNTDFGRNAASYIYSEQTGFVRMEDMKSQRYWHACGLHDGELVVVAGGYGSGTGYTSEFFNLNTMTWTGGPSVDTDTAGGEMFAWGGKTYWIGEKNIWRLDGNLAMNTAEWSKVAEMEIGGQSSQAFIMKAKDCKIWE